MKKVFLFAVLEKVYLWPPVVVAQHSLVVKRSPIIASNLKSPYFLYDDYMVITNDDKGSRGLGVKI